MDSVPSCLYSPNTPTTTTNLLCPDSELGWHNLYQKVSDFEPQTYHNQNDLQNSLFCAIRAALDSLQYDTMYKDQARELFFMALDKGLDLTNEVPPDTPAVLSNSQYSATGMRINISEDSKTTNYLANVVDDGNDNLIDDHGIFFGCCGAVLLQQLAALQIVDTLSILSEALCRGNNKCL